LIVHGPRFSTPRYQGQSVEITAIWPRYAGIGAPLAA
jgi:hypothetical protein